MVYSSTIPEYDDSTVDWTVGHIRRHVWQIWTFRRLLFHLSYRLSVNFRDKRRSEVRGGLDV